MALKTVTYDLTRGMVGADVWRLQEMLNQTQHESLGADGVYGAMTSNAIKRLQAKFGLVQNGQCSGSTLTKVRDLGYPAVEFKVGDGSDDINWPKKPSSAKLKQPNTDITRAMFGTFNFKHAPIPGNQQRINILGSWVSDNIVTVTVPQLVGIPIPIDDAHAVPSDGKIQCHKLAKKKILDLFQAWDDAGLTSRILTWYGCFNARLKRKKIDPKPENLSNHSWGSAFDITAKQNWLGEMPAVMGQRGCVRELVAAANDLGVYWGGHFGLPTSVESRDGMHFELAQL